MSQTPDHAGGIADGYHVGREISHHHGTGANDGVVADAE
jgi:hypothetical protein